MKNKRIYFIDMEKGIGILLMVGGHLLGEGGISFRGSMQLRKIIYRFHMPLFFCSKGIKKITLIFGYTTIIFILFMFDSGGQIYIYSH